MADVTGFDANSLIPTGPGDLVAQLNTAAQMRRWPWALLATVVVACISLSVTWLFALVMLLVGIALTVCLLLLEPPHKVEVSYDVDGPVADWFSAITAGRSQLAQLGGAWRINTKGAVQTIYQHKTNSGASHLVSRSRVRFSSYGPKMLVMNVPVPSVSSERHSLHLLPDRVLVRSGRNWSDIDYRHLLGQGTAIHSRTARQLVDRLSGARPAVAESSCLAASHNPIGLDCCGFQTPESAE